MPAGHELAETNFDDSEVWPSVSTHRDASSATERVQTVVQREYPGFLCLVIRRYRRGKTERVYLDELVDVMMDGPLSFGQDMPLAEPEQVVLPQLSNYGIFI